MDQQNVQVEDGIQLMDIVRLLISKIKLLLLAVLIGGIVGASFAVWRTYRVDYYGTSIEFYVNPERPEDSTSGDGSQYGVYGAYGRHVMDNMIRLLKSESFTEQLILNGKTLPDKTYKEQPWNPDSAEKNWATEAEEELYHFSAYLDEANAVDLEKKQAALAAAIDNRNEASSILSTAESELQNEWSKLSTSNLVSGKKFNEELYLGTNGSTPIKGQPFASHLDVLYAQVVKAKSDFEACLDTYKNAQADKDAADNVVNRALEAWSKTARYQSQLARYKGALSFSYLENADDFDDANNLARSFIYVDISVLNDDAFAKDLLERVKVVVPNYVKQKMTVPDGYEGTNCQRITRTDDIRLTNPLYTTKEAIKYGLVAGVLSCLVAAIIVVILDKSDKRLRDTEIITKKFNVPLLGVVPSIEELKSELNGKKNSTEVKK